MISIEECVIDLALIKDKHIGFVGANVQGVIKFYLEIFRLLERLDSNKKLKNSDINKEIRTIRQTHNRGDYKSLLQALLIKKPASVIKNENEAFKIKHSKYWLSSITDLDEIIEVLNELLKDYKKILGINFEKNRAANRRWYLISDKYYSKIDFILHKIFDYEEWFINLETTDTWGPYQLTESLNLDSCPYCNRQHTFTILDSKKGKIARPELDHFLPQSKHPLLTLSFYNLIPSCHVCNSSAKGSKETNYENYLNPYEENNKHSLMRFTYFPKTYEGSVGLTDEIEIELKYNGPASKRLIRAKVEGNIKLFCLKELYLNHKDNVQEIIRKREISGDEYIEILQSTFKHFPVKIEDAYRLAFGNYYLEKDFSKRTLSKLVKDIAIELDALLEYK